MLKKNKTAFESPQNLKKYYCKILEAFKGIVINENNLTNTLVKKFPIYDHKFIRAFTQTLIFNNKLEELSALEKNINK